MKILITGATGYVGGQLLPKLLASGHDGTCMVRDPSRAGHGLEGASVVKGDALLPDSLLPAMQGVEVAY